ncbi:MAG: sigma-54 dependent transcriptional regulator [Bacteroidota bacterium]
MEKLLVLQDRPLLSEETLGSLAGQYELVRVRSVPKAMDALRRQRIALALVADSSSEAGVLDVLSTIHAEPDPHLPVVVIADHGNIEGAVAAMQVGAWDYVTADISPQHLALRIRKVLERRNLEIRVRTLQAGLAEPHHTFLFVSDPMKVLNMEITRIARLDFDVLLEGETGVGKDLIASQIHLRSPRSEKPFFPISMRTLSETLIESELFGHEKGAFSGADHAKMGKLEAACGGTIYIPEISCLSPEMQLKLHYFMQYKRITRVGQDPRRSEIALDVRIVMATNEDLRKIVAAGRMREDFYHRITGVRLAIPPLRDRPEDVEPLARYFLGVYGAGKCGKGFELTPDATRVLEQYSWPGNVRELENVIKNAIACAEDSLLTPRHFPTLTAAHWREDGEGKEPGPFVPYKDAEFGFKRDYFQRLLALSAGSVSRAAQMARLTPQGLRKILTSLSLR